MTVHLMTVHKVRRVAEENGVDVSAQIGELEQRAQQVCSDRYVMISSRSAAISQGFCSLNSYLTVAPADAKLFPAVQLAVVSNLLHCACSK